MLHAVVPNRPLTPPPILAGAQLHVAQRCYTVGQRVRISGSGFTGAAPYDLSIDGVDFGQSLTNAGGAFSTRVIPGGLGAGQTQLAEHLSASDGQVRANTVFTVTRTIGALFGPGVGTSPRRAVPFTVWDFAPGGPAVNVFLHYVTPSGTVARTVLLGTSAGQCGALSTQPRELFPFTPSRGTWTFQFDTHAAYRSTAVGRSARLRVAIS